MQYWLVMPAAGTGRRFGGAHPKQYERIAGRTLIEWALAPFLADDRCQDAFIALAAQDTWFDELAIARHPAVCVVQGGAERCHSVYQALCALPAEDSDWVLVHDAARPCVARAEIDALIGAVADDPVGGLLALPLADTLKRADAGRVAQTPSREALWRALTPQMFRVGLLRRALAEAIGRGLSPTDEAQALEWLGMAPRLVPGSTQNLKVTGSDDLALAAAILGQRGNSMTMRVGSGFDVHAFGAGDSVMLGGVRIAHTQGVVAHSDGDVLLHALCDALLGAAALGDIGQHFPDSDPQWKGAASSVFVSAVGGLLAQRGYRVVNVDLTLLAEAPRIGAHRSAICASVAGMLGVGVECVNLKATTSERLGFTGRGEGLAAMATVLIEART